MLAMIQKNQDYIAILHEIVFNETEIPFKHTCWLLIKHPLEKLN